MLRTIAVCFAAGMGAGIGTGFVGLSAATVIAPILIAFLDCPWYEAVGIGLMSDVLASAAASHTYRKNGHIDLKNGTLMLASVLLLTVVGSYFSQYMPENEMGVLSMFAPILIGVTIFFRSDGEKPKHYLGKTPRSRAVLSLLCGAGIGFYCGFMGLGGGLTMLFMLTMVLGYDLKTAVGTSVFIMTFTALTGAVSHFVFGDVGSYLLPMLLCILFTLLWSGISARWANRVSGKTANRIAGVLLICVGIWTPIQKLIVG